MTNAFEERERNSSAVVSSIIWPPCPQPPSGSSVRLIFAGLMGICYNPTTRNCEVGFYKGGNHEPGIVVMEKPGCKRTTVSPGTGRMKIGITNQPSNVCFFKSTTTDFNRYTGNDWDIRWMIDLHEWYPDGNVLPGVFAPILEVTHGSLFTLQKTNSTFRRVEKQGIPEAIPFGYMPRFIAADIQTSGSQTVTLDNGSGVITTLRPTAQRSYEVVFTNVCNTPGIGSDFHLLVKSLASHGEPIYDFLLDVKGDQSDPPFCHEAIPEIKILRTKAVTEDAPCMASGFGKTPGFPG